MFYDFKRLNKNEFEVTCTNLKYKDILIRCSSIQYRNANIPFYVCNSQIKSDIQSGIIKICQVLDGMNDIKTLYYKKYENVYEDIKNELGKQI